MNRLARAIRDDFGLQIQFHPHADTHVDTHANVERFLAETDPDLVTLCLDTGHIAYCEGDNLKLIQDHPERIGYVHLKQVDPAVMDKVRAEGIGFGEAVKLGAMCEPPHGDPRPGADPRRPRGARPRRAVRDRRARPLPLRAGPAVPIATRTLDYLAPADPRPERNHHELQPPSGRRHRRRHDGRRPRRAPRQPGRQRHPGAVADPDQARAQQLAAQFPGVQVFADPPRPHRRRRRRRRPHRVAGFVHAEQLLACIEQASTPCARSR